MYRSMSVKGGVGDKDMEKIAKNKSNNIEFPVLLALVLYVMKDIPQPQDSFTLGLLNTNCADNLSST